MTVPAVLLTDWVSSWHTRQLSDTEVHNFAPERSARDKIRGMH